MEKGRAYRARFRIAVAAAVWGAIAAPPEHLVLRHFERTIALENTDANTAGVSVGEVNGDGRLDIVLGKGHHKPLRNRVLLNTGDGHFTGSDLGADPDRTYSAQLADLDRDGDLDIVVSNDSPDRKLMYKNDGEGRFTLSGHWGEANWPTRHVSLPI